MHAFDATDVKRPGNFAETDLEAKRLAALHAYGLLDTARDPAYDAFATLASAICGTPIALVSLVDSSRQWFKANVGLEDVAQTHRDIAFCSHAIESNDFFEVPDARNDPRFAENPLVTGEQNFRFYAGVPLVDRDGQALGTLCALDRRPRMLTSAQREALTILAGSLVTLIEARKGVPVEKLEQLNVLSGALEHAPDPVAILSVEVGRPPTMAYVNPAFARLFMYAAADLIGKRPTVLSGPKTDMQRIDRLEAAVAEGTAGSETVFLYTSTGSTRLVEIRDRLIDARHRIVSARDLTRVHEVQEALLRTNERLQSLLANNSSAILTIDLHGVCSDANQAALATFGYKREELLGFGYLRLAGTGPSFRGELFPQALVNGETIEFEDTFTHADGHPISVECKALPMAVRGVIEGAYVSARDVTNAIYLSQRLEGTGKRTHALCEISSAVESTNDERIAAALKLVLGAFDMETGYVGEIVGDSIRLLHVVGDPIFPAGTILELRKTYVYDTLTADDVYAVSDLAVARPGRADLPVYDKWHGYISAPLRVEGRVYGAIGFLSRNVVAFDQVDRDFTRLVATLVSTSLERERQQQHLDRLAFYDVLTGLPNRANFMARIEKEFEKAKRDDESFALQFIDLDGFKNVNDVYGHGAGDGVLQETARRIRAALHRSTDTAARLGGDEFVVLQPGVSHPAEAEALGKRLVKVLSSPYSVNGVPLEVTASIGIAIYPDDGSDIRALLARADIALYRAKAKGKNRVEVDSVQLL